MSDEAASTEEGDDGVPGSGSGKAPTEPLPDLNALIERAREDARRKRRELGLPPLSPDELEQPRQKRGRRAKRTKDHGRFMRGSQ